VTHLIERFTELLKKGKYNTVTIAAYRNAVFVFYNHFRDVPQTKITDEVISAYLIELASKKGDSTDAVKQAGKAIKLFFEMMLSRKLNIKATGEIKENTLPEILTEEEIVKLLHSLDNTKHKALLAIIYAAGLRLSEVLDMKVADLDFEKNVIRISPTSKEKGRDVMMAVNLKPILSNYLNKHQPKDLLFGGDNGKSYSARSVQLVFQQALKKANINKNASVHTLRHSFAVHFLERGLDIHHLQDMLGHRYLQTTAIYTQLAKVEFTNFRSPMDDLKF
jgi:integrase/recombinase XerD